jgi:hypothetical protein
MAKRMPIVGPEIRAAVATDHASEKQLPSLSCAYALLAALAFPITTRNELRNSANADPENREFTR